MAVPESKKELLDEIEKSYSKLRKELEGISEDNLRKMMEGHVKNTEITVLNLVSYLIGWWELVLKWNRGDSENLEYLPENGYKWNELWKLAEKFYEDYKEYSYKELLKILESIVEKIIELIQSLENNKLYGSTWYKKYSRWRMIQLNTASPYKNAYSRIRKWKKIHNLK